MKTEDNFIIFSDIKRLFFKTKWIILAGAVVCGCVGFFKRTQVPVRHEVAATFKEQGKSQVGFGSGLFDSVLQSLGVGGANQGNVLLLSSVIMEPVIENLGMQVEIAMEGTGEKKRRLFREALNAERGRSILRPSCFEFAHVHYRGEYPRGYQIFFTSRESFEVRDAKNHVLVKGLAGDAVSFDGVGFTLVKTPTEMQLRHSYPLSIAPLSEKVLELKKMFTVCHLEGDASLLGLAMTHPNRHFAMRLLNAIMGEYQRYLESENARVSDGQIAYLEKRRDEFCEKMNEYLKTHVAYLKENLETKGFLNLGQQLPLFQSRKQELLTDLMDLDVKVEQLIDTDPLLAMELGREVESLQGELHHMTKERDELTLALLGNSSYEKNLAEHLSHLSAIDREELSIKTGVDTFFSSLSSALRQRDKTLVEVGEFGKVLSPNANQLKRVQQEKMRLIGLMRENPGTKLTSDYIKNHLRLLSLQEGTLKKRLFYGTTREEEYRGIDLETARKLLFTYLQARDNAASKMREMEFAQGQIEKDNAEWISIASVFPDPLCQEMVREMGALKQQLRKKRTLTEKEKERLEKKVAQMEGDLHRHIKQVVALTELEKVRSEDRIESVRLAILDLLGQEVSLIEKQIEDRIEEKLAHLGKEKKLVKRQLADVLSEMNGIPDTWLRERELKFAADMNKGMLEALVQLVESKSIERNLATLESVPLDLAQTSLSPKPPLLKIFGVIGAFLGALLTFAFCFIYYLQQGFPLTLRNMAMRGKKILGPLSHKIVIEEGSKDLEVLRRFSLLIKEENRASLVACLILGSGEDYSPSFAELLAKEGKKVLVIDLDFSKNVKQKNLPGLIHFLEGESKEPSIREKSYGHYIPMGGNTPFGDEILRSAKFDAFLNEIKLKYDVVLLSLPAKAESSLPKTFFNTVDVMALKLDDLPYRVLAPYFAWESEGHSLAFM